MITYTKVHLREKKLKSGKSSLYLDFYPPIFDHISRKKKRREFLNLQITTKPTTKDEREYNRQVKAIAEKLAAQRQLDIINENFNFMNSLQSTTDFVSYFADAVMGKHQIHKTAYKYFTLFCKGKCSFRQITPSLCESFKSFLMNTGSIKDKSKKLNTNTCFHYFKIFLMIVKRAQNDDLITRNVFGKVRNIRKVETKINYLTEDEIKRLYNTPCKNLMVRKASFFAIYTGLRVSDILALEWNNIVRNADGTFSLQMRSKKESNILNNHLREEALYFLGNRQEGKIFDGLQYHTLRRTLKEWLKAAGINKKITFHCFRHTYATQMLNKGCDLMTLSKLMGHTSPNTTLIYAEITDQHKKDMASKICIADFMYQWNENFE